MATLKSNTHELREKLYERQGKSRFGNIQNLKNPLNYAGTTLSGIFSDLSQGFVEKTSGLTNGDINKLWRAKILLDRLGGPATGRTIGLPRDSNGSTFIPNKLPYPDLKQGGGYSIPEMNRRNNILWRYKVRNGLTRPSGEVDGEHFETLPIDTPSTKTFKVFRTATEKTTLHDSIRNHRRNEVIIFNLNGNGENYQYIILQNRPPEVEFQGETSWAAIKSFGRNVPMYHFTGAEDKLQLQVSWFCNDPVRPWEVIQKCRLLEAWSKSNGYAAGPPVLQIDWGGSGIFDNAYFILTSATYVLKQFRDGYIDRRSTDSTWQDGKLYPMAATQELIFSRVSGTNPTYSSIYDPNKLTGIKGIGTGNKKTIANPKDNQSSLWQA